ncbi:hypothetical protein ITJ88_01750 [Exiguobacterium sp. TBG-PICH-001]|uniref:hypothetical protein n=1 Tax=Exiguobacterium abrahamii TaxID=2785532 RepID=UPI0018A7199E|nr:hypothetical protein [Exiguobacterium sp. TBG-PICH-001]MBF8151994.1 hypothetical protein [Exiguobacterium sp. TBG-PICH-001]
MSPLDPLRLKTKRLIELLDQTPNEETYDEWIEKIQGLLNEREAFIAAHSNLLAGANQAVIQELVADSRKIDLKLSAETAKLGVQISQLRQTQTSRKSYVDPYKEVDHSFSPYFDSRQ